MWCVAYAKEGKKKKKEKRESFQESLLLRKKGAETKGVLGLNGVFVCVRCLVKRAKWLGKAYLSLAAWRGSRSKTSKRLEGMGQGTMGTCYDERKTIGRKKNSKYVIYGEARSGQKKKNVKRLGI